MSDRLRGPVLWLFVAAAVVLASGIGLRDPWPPDEPRFALVAKDMVESGAWFIPRVGGVIYPDKPPLFFWFVAVFYALTGSLRIAFLAPALVAGLTVLALVYDLARRLWDPETAVLAGAALLVTLQFPLQMKAGQIDGFLCLWTTLGLYGFSRHLLLGPDWRWYGIGGFACGLGVITKGVGFLPFLLLIPWLVAARYRWQLPAVNGGLRWLLAPAAFLAAIALWLLPMLLATTGSADPDMLAYRNDILFRQTVTRYADAWGHIKPFWYLFSNAVPWLWLPLTFLLPWLVPAWVRDLRRRTAATLMFGGWILLVLLFFSLSNGKRSVYIFPALPALVLLAAPHLPGLVARKGVRRVLFALALMLAVLPLGIGIASLAEPQRLRAFLANSADAASLSWTAIGIGGFATVLAGLFGLRRAAQAFAGVTACWWILAPLLVYPLIDSTRSGRALVEAAAASLSPGQVLAFAGWKEQFLLQWDRPAVHFGYRRDNDEEARHAARWVSADPDRRLLLRGDLADPCFDRSTLEALGLAHRDAWYLAAAQAVTATCRAGPGDKVGAIAYLPGEARNLRALKSARRSPATARSEAR